MSLALAANRSLDQDCGAVESVLSELFRAHPDGATAEDISAASGVPAWACYRVAQRLYAEHKARWVDLCEFRPTGGRPRKVLRPLTAKQEV